MIDPARPEPVLGVTFSLTRRRWVWRAAEDRVALGIAQRLAVPELVGRMLAARGVGIEDAADFLSPTLRALLPDPSVLTDMDVAAERLARAVIARETVGIFGDYDVDGACSGALMAGLLRRLGCDAVYYVPDRLSEGYGPNLVALRRLVERGAKLIVCVDCGTAAHAVLAEIRPEAEVIVLDHHKAEGPPPPVLATVNPNRLDDRSGLGTLCATGVAFLTGVALLRALRRHGALDAATTPDLMSFLDLVALATICDVMPLTGVNRALVAQGLKVMARRARPGIAALLDVAQIDGMPNAMSCGYGLGPRINAGGRIAQSEMGTALLLEEDPAEARALASQLDAVNRQRQEVEAEMLDQAMAIAEDQIADGHGVLMIAHPGWHPGVVGIIAGRIKDRFNRPVCVAALADNLAKGSGRSVPGLDLGAVVIAARQAGLLRTGGGHAMAAGFMLDAARVLDFHGFLESRLTGAAQLPEAVDLPVEGSLSVPGATLELAETLGRLAPFGLGNEEPVLVLPRVRVVRADKVGREGTSVRSFIEGEGGGARLKAMLFRPREPALAEALLNGAGAPLHLAGYLRAETWNGRTTLGFTVIDAAPA